MDKTNFKDAYDIGENMAVLSGKGRSYTIINKETGKARQLVSEDGTLLVADNEIDFDATDKDLEIIVPFQPMNDVKEILRKYENL